MSLVSSKRWLYLALSLMMALTSFSAFAQRVDGNIGGEAVAGDQISISNANIGVKRDTVADEQGKYRFRSLPLGEYDVKVTRNGESVGSFKVAVRPGATSRVPNVSAKGEAAAQSGDAGAAN